MVKAPLPNRIIHVHALVATFWMLSLVARVSLVSAHRVDLHRRLGVIALAFRMRGDPPAHKRSIVIANVALMFAGFIRWLVEFLHHDIPAAARAPYCFMLLLVLYELRSTRRIHPVTLWASAFLVFVVEVQFSVAETMTWRSFAAWVRSIG